MKSILSASNCILHFNREYSGTIGNSYWLPLVFI